MLEFKKELVQDLIAGRGDWKTNVSKITYYGIMQNLIFNALQNALFLIVMVTTKMKSKKLKQVE